MTHFARYYQRYSKARLKALIILSLAILQFPLAVSASLVALPAIAQDLQVNAVLISWIPAIFLLVSLISQLPGGRLSDLIGLKKSFLISCGLFAIGGAMAAFAPNIETLLAGRVVQGAAGAVLASAGMAMISRIYAAGGRGAALGWMTSAVYLGMTAGPLIGGWLVDLFGWRSVFILPVPILLGVILSIRLSIPGEWKSSEKHKIDWVGTAIFSAAIAALYFGSTRLIELNGWLLTVLGVGLGYHFIKWSGKQTFPLVRIDLMMKNKTFINSATAAMFMYASQYGIVLILSLYLQYNRQLSPTDTGQLMMLQALMMTIIAPLAGRVSDRIGHRLLATGGSLSIAVGLLALALMNHDTPLWVIGLCIMVIGTGHGMFSTPNNSAALATLPAERMGIGSAILSLSRQSGQLIGMAVITLLLGLYFAGAAIGESDPQLLESVTTNALTVSLLTALLAAWFSWRKV